MNMVQQWFGASTVISRNDMVLCVPKGNPKHVKSIEDLARLELRVGLGHRNSALGALTDDLLKKLQLHDKVYDPAQGPDRPYGRRATHWSTRCGPGPWT